MKLKFLLIALLLNFSSVFSQEDKTVTLTVSAQGPTLSEAKQNALRDAIEQAFGAFISSNTEILNDELVKDEIVSVSNGNIQDYEVISEMQLPEGSYATTLKATVSVTKLTSFVESKGVVVKFKGGLFAFNLNQQMLNEENEVKAIKDLCLVIKNIADTSFDYTITVSDPRSLDSNNSKFKIPFYVSVFKNENFDKLTSLLYENLKSLLLTDQEAADYKKIDKDIYTVSIAVSENENSQVFLRKKESVTELLKTLYYFNYSLQNFKINNGKEEWLIKDYPKNVKYIYDGSFRIFLFLERSRPTPRSVFYYSLSKPCIGEDKTYDKTRRVGVACNTRTYLDYREYFKPYNYVKETYITNFKLYKIDHSSNPRFFNTDRNDFSFVKKFNRDSNLVISFVTVNKTNEELVRFYYEDIRTLDEIQNISEYTVKPLD